MGVQIMLEEEKIKFLCQTDEKLKQLIYSIGSIEKFSLEKDYYKSLVKRIIGQQVSLKVAAIFEKRIDTVWENFNPEKFQYIKEIDLREAGLSYRKISYIRDLTEKYVSGELDFDKLPSLSDQEVINELTKVKGIGQWSAEMFMIFSLGRLNILSFADVSIQNAIRWLYDIPKEEHLDLHYYYEKWNPYNSIASLYLWEAIDRGFTAKKPLEALKLHEAK